MQQYLLKKRRRKSLFVLSPAIPMATLFGGCALFYFFFSPSPMPEMQEVKVTVLGAYDMENRHRGQDGSLAFACPASFHVWTVMKKNELKRSSLFLSLSLSLFLSLSLSSSLSYSFILSPYLQKLHIHYKCILYMYAYIKYINIYTLCSTHVIYTCALYICYLNILNIFI